MMTIDDTNLCIMLHSDTYQHIQLKTEERTLVIKEHNKQYHLTYTEVDGSFMYLIEKTYEAVIAPFCNARIVDTTNL